jgi:hypothetical protein
MRRLGDPWFNRIGLRGPVPWGNTPGGYGGSSYIDKILGYSPVAYWPLYEISGVVAADLSGNGFNGVYSSNVSGWPPETGIGDGNTAPFFDGASKYVLLTSAGLTAAFPKDEGTIFIWAKVFNSGVWTDAAVRRAINFRYNTQNQQYIQRTVANNTLNYYRIANNIADQITQSPVSSLNWMCLVYTYSVANDKFIAYYNGVQTGLTQTGIGSWAAGAIGCWIGCYNAATNFWYGPLAHAAIFGRPLNSTEIANLYVI